MSSEEMKVVDEYLAVLRNASAAAPAAERAEFMREIHSHILDRIEAENCVTEGQVREILQRIGDPHRLATQLGTESMLRRAVKSISPLFLLRTTLRWAMTGLAG